MSPKRREMPELLKYLKYDQLHIALKLLKYVLSPMCTSHSEAGRIHFLNRLPASTASKLDNMDCRAIKGTHLRLDNGKIDPCIPTIRPDSIPCSPAQSDGSIR